MHIYIYNINKPYTISSLHQKEKTQHQYQAIQGLFFVCDMIWLKNAENSLPRWAQSKWPHSHPYQFCFFLVMINRTRTYMLLYDFISMPTRWVFNLAQNRGMFSLIFCLNWQDHFGTKKQHQNKEYSATLIHRIHYSLET